MKIGVLGTGMVGQAIAGKLAALGHEVKMGAREAGNEKAAGWAKGAGPRASHGTFADAAAFAEIVFHCALGSAALDVLEAAGSKNLAGRSWWTSRTRSTSRKGCRRRCSRARPILWANG